jgi:hypothetical protein
VGLGQGEDFLLRIHDPRGAQVVLKHYPSIPIQAIRDGNTSRLTAHTDFSSMTLLLQNEQGGLEVETNGRFVCVPYIPGTMVLNIGDIFQVWSNSKSPHSKATGSSDRGPWLMFAARLPQVHPAPGWSSTGDSMALPARLRWAREVDDPNAIFNTHLLQASMGCCAGAHARL